MKSSNPDGGTATASSASGGGNSSASGSNSNSNERVGMRPVIRWVVGGVALVVVVLLSCIVIVGSASPDAGVDARNFKGVPYSFDVGSVVTAFLAVLAALGVTGWLKDAWTAEERKNREERLKNAEDERQEKALEAEKARESAAQLRHQAELEARAESDRRTQERADARLAREKEAEANRLAAAAAQERIDEIEAKYRERKEALEIHESTTTREVFEAIAQRDTDPSAKPFLVATYKRGNRRYQAFNETSDDIDTDLDSLIVEALEEISKLYPGELKKEADEVIKKKKRRTENSRFDVGDHSRLTKFQTLHVIGQRFCKLHDITTRDQFVASFSPIVKEAVKTSASEEIDAGKFIDTTVLYDPTAGSEKYRAKYGSRDAKFLEKLGPINLDGIDHMIGWDLGFKSGVKDIGRRVHLPVINHFKTMDGYKDITPA